ncbi:MAG: phosphomannomutase [Patescibacteria group bacterium]|jgi:HAD superfamily hydrolase (TIGR01484 family)|nr:phosphomannomutase [Patescibacteria group bacterium]
MTPQAIAFDLDGTLAESKQPISTEMGVLLEQLIALMPVAIMSGDSFEHFEAKLLQKLPSSTHLPHVYLFPTNAGACVVYKNGTWERTYDFSFSPQERAQIREALDTALGAVGLAEEPKPVWGQRIEDRGAQISFSPLGQQAPVEAKEAWRTEYNDLRTAAWEQLVQLLPEFDVKMGGITTIDIVHKGITKAYGVKKFAELTNVTIKDMLYVGDALGEGGNDAVVLEVGVPTHATKGPAETAEIIQAILHATPTT